MAKNKGERIKVETNNSDGNITVINEGNGVVNVYPQAVPELSKRLSSYFNQLNNLIGDSKDRNGGIQVNEESSKYFVKQTSLNDDVQIINGIIYKIDATKLTGNIEVKDGSKLIVPGKYKFSFIDRDELTIQDIKRILMTETEFRCLAKTRIDPSNLVEDVIELKIIKIENYEAK